jgi:D-alanyl-D-alanine carboxypeptidase (penicillin-binding protein 5/6)
MKKILYSIVFITLMSQSALAQNLVPEGGAAAVAPVETSAKQAFLMDANTATELYAKDADTPMPTSSMSKMMTIYLVFEAVKSGKLRLDDTLTVSENAWRHSKDNSSSMFLNIGQRVAVEDLIRGVVVQSGNDAATVFAEALGSGSETTFADIMNAKAQQLGMTHSHFINASGMPDPQHYSTARDLALLAYALLRDFPEFYHYFSEQEFTFNGIKQGNRNPLLYRNIGVDGLKTGHTDSGGYGLTASALREDRRLILVLNGLPTMQSRADESAKMLDWGFREYGFYHIASMGDKIADARVTLGEAKSVPLLLGENIDMTLPKSVRPALQQTTDYTQKVEAPVIKGQKMGVLKIEVPGLPERQVALLAGNDVPRLGFFPRMMAKLKMMFSKSDDATR